jgi:hypothetical protein
MIQIILMISELCKKHKKLKVEIQDTKVKKHLLLKDYGITMNILKNITQKTFDCKFKGGSKRIREDKNSNAPSSCLPFSPARTTQTANLVPCNYLRKNPRQFNLVLELKCEK